MKKSFFIKASLLLIVYSPDLFSNERDLSCSEFQNYISNNGAENISLQKTLYQDDDNTNMKLDVLNTSMLSCQKEHCESKELLSIFYKCFPEFNETTIN